MIPNPSNMRMEQERRRPDQLVGNESSASFNPQLYPAELSAEQNMIYGGYQASRRLTAAEQPFGQKPWWSGG